MDVCCVLARISRSSSVNQLAECSTKTYMETHTPGVLCGPEAEESSVLRTGRYRVC